MLAAVLPAAGLSLAWTGRAAEGEKVNRLGGAWVGDDGKGFRLNHVQIPLDPAGKTAAVHVTAITNAGIPPVITDATDLNGPMMMTGKDTAEGTLIGYALYRSNPMVWNPTIVGTFVTSVAFTFLDPDTMEGYWWTRFYPFDGELLPTGGPDPVKQGPMILRRLPFVPPPAA